VRGEEGAERVKRGEVREVASALRRARGESARKRNGDTDPEAVYEQLHWWAGYADTEVFNQLLQVRPGSKGLLLVLHLFQGCTSGITMNRSAPPPEWVPTLQFYDYSTTLRALRIATIWLFHLSC